MSDEKDRFGETMRLVERAKEDIYFAEEDRKRLENLRSRLQKVETQGVVSHCPKCPGNLETYTFHDFVLERCHECGGVWMEKGELEAVVRKISRGPLGNLLDKLLGTRVWRTTDEKPGTKNVVDND